MNKLWPLSHDIFRRYLAYVKHSATKSNGFLPNLPGVKTLSSIEKKGTYWPLLDFLVSSTMSSLNLVSDIGKPTSTAISIK